MKIQFRKKHIPYFILIFFGTLLLAMGILNHYFFRTVSYDYGNYNFAFWDYSHFRISPLPTSKGNFLQDHFSLTLMYFVPIYWLLNWLTHTYTLIILQYTLVAISAWYTYKIIRIKSDNIWLGAGVILYYFVLLGRYTTFLGDVNLAIISSCFIPIFIYYFKTQKYILSLIILILSLFSRENIPLWFIFIFVVLIIEHKKDKKAVLFSIGGIVISIVYFILLFKVFIPSVETSEMNYSLFRYAALGATPGEAFIYIINNPIDSIKMFFVNHLNNPAHDNVKMEFYWVYIISGGFILFRKPQYFIWFIPIVAQKVLNDSYVRWGIGTYYSIEVVTLLPLSVFLVISSLKSRIVKNSLTIAVCLATITMTIYKLDKKNNEVKWILNESKSKVYSKKFFEAPFNVKGVNKLLKQIPTTAKVSASNIILPHLAQRKNIYFFPNVQDADYIVFSVFDNHYMYSYTNNEKYRNKYFSDPNWEIVAQEFPVFLFKSNKSSGSNKSSINKLTVKTDTLYCNYEKIDLPEKHKFLSDKEKKETKRYLTTEKSLSGIHSIKLTSKGKYGSKIKIKDTNQKDFIQISAWCYSEEEKQVHVVADYGKDFHFHSVEVDSTNQLGWKRLVLSFWIPQNTNQSDCTMYIWNSGEKDAYIDDLQVIKRSSMNN